MNHHLKRVVSACSAALLSASAALADGAPNIHMATLASITIDGSRSCGGVPIGATLVMTSAHCVTREATVDPVHPDLVEVSIMAFESDPVSYKVVDVGIPSGFSYEGVPTRDVVGRDIALLRLAAPINSPFETVAPAEEGLTHTALRAISEGRGLPVEVCETRVESGNVMALECAREPGSSGSPVFGIIGGDRSVIGIVSAGGERGDGSPLTFATVAQPLFPEISWLMQERGIITGF